MKLGSRVIVTRGCNSCGSSICANNKRDVPGLLLHILNVGYVVRLDYLDGPDPKKSSELDKAMWFSKSQVRPA